MHQRRVNLILCGGGIDHRAVAFAVQLMKARRAVVGLAGARVLDGDLLRRCMFVEPKARVVRCVGEVNDVVFVREFVS